MKQFDHKTYVRLMRESWDLALQYRKDCGLLQETPKTAPISNDTSSQDTTQAEETKNTSEEVKNETKIDEVEKNDAIEFTREDLEKKLTDAGVKFSHLAKDETLLKKCIENNLI